MTNLEWVFNNWDDDDLNVSVCILAHISRYHETCDDKNCFECEFFKNNKKCVKELLQEHKEKVKLKQWEYDVLKAVKAHNQAAHMFNNSSILKQLVNKGYFKGVADTKEEIESAIIQHVLDNSVIVADD